MYAQVTRDQFQINEEVIIHRPTRAEFTPTLGHADSRADIQVDKAKVGF